MRSTIDEELASYVDAEERRMRKLHLPASRVCAENYFNNFYVKFDLGEPPKGSQKRNILFRAGYWDRTHQEYYLSMDRLLHRNHTDDELLRRMREVNSPLFLGNSPAMFFATIDKLVSRCKLDQSKIAELARGPFAMAQTNAYVKPVYMIMRELGYWHADLA
jgi:hypothetical protein